MSKELFVGCDVSSTKFTACCLLQDGTYSLKPSAFDNNQPGAEEFTHRLKALAQEHIADAILVGVEATGIYDWHLLEFLAQSDLALCYRLKLYRLNTKLLHNFRKSLPNKGKTDLTDSYLIAERLRLGRLPDEYNPDYKYLPLRRLTRFRYHLVNSMAREKSYFLSNLFLKASSYNELKPFGSTFTSTSKAVIEDFYSTEEIANTPVEELVDFLVREGKNRFKEPKRIALDLKRVCRESYRLRPELQPPVNLILALSLNNIRCFKENIKQVDDAIKSEVKAFKHTLESMPGLGPVYSAGIIAEIGDITRFKSEAALAQFAGLSWPKHQSGNFQAEETRLSKSGNKYLRYFLVEAANSVKVHNAIFKDFYQKKYQESLKHHHKRALVLTARKLVRVIFALLSKNELYQASKAALLEA